MRNILVTFTKWILLLTFSSQATFAAGTLTYTTITGGTLTATDLSGGNVTATGATAAQTMGARAAQHLSPLDFGAKCDGTTDDTTALNAWFGALVSTGASGELPPATCKANSALTWNMAGRASGIRVQGASQGASELDLSGVTTGTPLLFTGSGTNLFYGHFSDFTVLTNINGPGVQIGVVGLTDALNGFSFHQIEFKNAANNAAAIALQVNGCLNCSFDNVTTNTGGGSTNNSGLGVSLEIKYAAFSRFMGSFSSAATGLHLTTGYVFGNVFEAMDIENVNTGIVIDSVNAARNTFLGGTYGAYTGLSFTAGSANVVSNPNISPYTGGTNLASTIGMWLQLIGVGVTTPAMPASTVATTNTTGREVLVIVNGGTATQVVAGGGTYALGQGTFLLKPGDTIAITYTVAPAWGWVPVL